MYPIGTDGSNGYNSSPTTSTGIGGGAGDAILAAAQQLAEISAMISRKNIEAEMIMAPAKAAKQVSGKGS